MNEMIKVMKIKEVLFLYCLLWCDIEWLFWRLVILFFIVLLNDCLGFILKVIVMIIYIYICLIVVLVCDFFDIYGGYVVR